ncbi:hypothetical protein Tco_1110224 [Tanacetum coccineum]|uniref:Uncharacterized protein n=1 Tax=Tanacetum coccineum TaxID=301880 RepID=A0ABQ5IJD6_9ASTR
MLKTSIPPGIEIDDGPTAVDDDTSISLSRVRTSFMLIIPIREIQTIEVVEVHPHDSKENFDDSLVKEQVSKDSSSFVESSLNVDKESFFSVDKKDCPDCEDSQFSGYHQKDRKPSQNDKTEHGMEKTVQNQGQSPKNANVRVITEESAATGAELKNTYWMNLNPLWPGKPNSIIMKTVKTKWALNQIQQPICVQLTKTVKTLKAQS